MGQINETGKVNISIAAKRLGMSQERLSAELQRDSMRPINERHYPFANPRKNEENGRWKYNIYEQKLNTYLSPEIKQAANFDYDRLAKSMVNELLSRLHDLQKVGCFK